MTEEIKDIKKYIINKKHVKFRFNAEETEKSSIRKSSEICGIDRETLQNRKKVRLCSLLEAEKPAFIPGMNLVFMRTTITNGSIVNTEEEKELRNLYYLHEKGHVCNILSLIHI